MICVNLIPMPRRQQRKLRARRRRWAFAAAIYGMLLAAGYGAWRVAWGGDDLNLNHQLTLLHSDIDEGARTAARLRVSLRDAQLVARANRAVTGQPDWSLLLALVADLRGDDVVLNQCKLEIAAKSVGLPALSGAPAASADAAPAVLHLQGHGRQQASVSQYALALERTGLFETVSLLKTSRDTFLGGDAIAFRLECFLKASFSDSPGAKPKPATSKNPRGVVTDVSDAGGNAP